ncbi:universal stress protein [Catenulispora subtropica]|uniref:Universal stress protein n=1 Tax=Catenulispora subtropica TaxID=450798 RepID=A0ABN2TED8_9ACTN
MDGVVIVGYDKTAAGERALAFAGFEAALHGVALEIVNVVPAAGGRSSAGPAGAVAAWTVAQGERTARTARPELRVTKYAAVGSPDQVLTREARGAGMLVLGERGHRDFAPLRRGAVTVDVLDRATCPVVVLSPVDHPPRQRVTVAVDLDEPIGELLAFAFAEAARRAGPLVVANVCEGHAVPDRRAFDEGDIRSEATLAADHVERLAAAAAPWRDRYPDVEVEEQVRTGSIGSALVDATRDGDLLIVGGRRHGDGRPGMEIGPAVHTLLHHAECPVAVVPIG